MSTSQIPRVLPPHIPRITPPSDTPSPSLPTSSTYSHPTSVVWTKPHVYDETLVNPNVDLHDLGLSNFRGIYSSDTCLSQVLKNIRRFGRLRFDRYTVSTNPPRQKLEINGVWISDGVGVKMQHAKVSAIRNSFIHLVKQRGLQIMAAEQIQSHAIMRLPENRIMAGTNLNMDQTKRFELYQLNAARCLTEFLMDPSMFKLEITFKRLDSSRFIRDITDSIKRCRLGQYNIKKVNKVVVCWKVNSIWHNMFDAPATILAQKVPSIGQILARKDKIKALKDPLAEEYVEDDEGDVGTREMEPFPANMSKNQRKKARKLKKREMKKEKKARNKLRKLNEAEDAGTASSGTTDPGKKQSSEYDVSCINPELYNTLPRTLLRQFLPGFSYLTRKGGYGSGSDCLPCMEMSAFYSGFSCHFVAEPASQDCNVTVKLTMRNEKSPKLKEVWVALGAGKTFESAKVHCARNALGFLQISQQFRKFNNKFWTRFMMRAKSTHPDRCWFYSAKVKDDSVPNSLDNPALSPSTLDIPALQEILMKFNDDLVAWRLQITDIASPSDGEIILTKVKPLGFPFSFNREQGYRLIIVKGIHKLAGKHYNKHVSSLNQGEQHFEEEQFEDDIDEEPPYNEEDFGDDDVDENNDNEDFDCFGDGDSDDVYGGDTEEDEDDEYSQSNSCNNETWASVGTFQHDNQRFTSGQEENCQPSHYNNSVGERISQFRSDQGHCHQSSPRLSRDMQQRLGHTSAFSYDNQDFGNSQNSPTSFGNTRGFNRDDRFPAQSNRYPPQNHSARQRRPPYSKHRW